MVTMVLMQRYHVNSASDNDPLKPLLRAYRVNAKAIERKIEKDTAAKIATIQGALREHKAKQRN